MNMEPRKACNRRRLIKTAAILAAAAALTATCKKDKSGTDEIGPDQALVLRDEYGVPHIYAGGIEPAAFAWGYVHAQNLRDKGLMAWYAGEARSAELFGHDCGEFGDCVENDTRALLFEIPDLVARDYPSLLENTRTVLEAFAAGVNHFHEQQDPPSQYYVRPVTAQAMAGTMMLLDIRHAIERSQVVASLRRAGILGSNQFAATGARTAADTTVVSIDPHTPWGSAQNTVHVQFDDFDIVGSSLAFPVIHCGGNNFVQWGCTTLNSASAVVIQAEISGDGLSYFDHAAGAGGGFVEFDRATHHLEVAGDPAGEDLEFLYTRWGPVAVTQDSTAYVLHVFSADDITYVDYMVGLWQTRSLEDFADLFAGGAGDPSTNRIFGTRDHHIGYVYSAYVAVLDLNLDWSMPVSSADPRIEWTPEQFYDLDGADPELPHVFDPTGDFVQNSNGHPAWSTEPSGQIPATIPVTLHAGTGPSIRGERLRELLIDGAGIDGEQAMAIATDIKILYAERAIEALRRGLDDAGITDPVAEWGQDVGELVNLLLAWRDFNDYQASADCEAMTVLFLLDDMVDMDFPPPGVTLDLPTIEAMAQQMAQVAQYMRDTYTGAVTDPLHVPWGYVNRAVVGGREIAMSGGTRGLPALFMAHGDLGTDGRMLTDSGSHYMQVAVFGPAGFEVYLTAPNGHVDEELFPDSPHVGQTIDDFVARAYRRVWLDRNEVESHLCPHADQPGHEHPARLMLTWPR